jgi:hypothetical protein
MLLLSAALLLRAVIPAGYMPAAAGSGLLFELCPLGIPVEMAQVLAGEAGHHHGHADIGDSGTDEHQCQVGHMLLSAAAVDNAWQPDLAAPALALSTVATYSYKKVSRKHYHSRGPPA